MSLPEPEVWEKNHPLNGHACPVTGVIPLVEDRWTIARPDYRLRTGVVEPGIVLSLPVGHTVIADTNQFFVNLQDICESGHVDRENFVLIEDYTYHTGSDYEGRISYIDRMIKEIRPKGVIFFTRSYYWRLNIRLGVAIGRWALNVQLASSYQQAFELASGLLGRPIAVRESGVPFSDRDSGFNAWAAPRESLYMPAASPLTDGGITEAMKILSALQWENFGFHVDMDSTRNPDFEKLVVAIGALKHDVDEFFAAREDELAALESAALRAEMLSAEIEKELDAAREADQLAQELAHENNNLSADINLSQKEVFLVLADDVDVRSGARPGYTRALARQVARIAEKSGCSATEVRDMYDATLLHHIGFLGIPDTSGWLDENHCRVGLEVLGRIPGDVAQTARAMAGYHHERFDGQGFPFGLKGEEIPLPARLLRVAAQILQPGAELAIQSGRELDPSLVAAVSARE